MRRALVLLLGALVVGAVALAVWPTPTPPPPPRDAPPAPAPVAASVAPAPRSAPKPPAVAGAPDTRPAPPRRPADPVLAAIATGDGPRAAVLDVTAMRDTRLAKMLVACLNQHDRGQLDRFRDEMGWDPIQSVDRVAGGDSVVVLEGRFAGVRWEKLREGLVAERRGATTLYRGEGGEQFASLGDGLVVVGRDAEALEAAIARIEGRAPAEPVEVGTGDIWGRGTASDLLEPLSLPPEVRMPLASMLDAAELTMGYEARFADDAVRVALRIDAPGDEASLVTDALGAALSTLRGRAAEAADSASMAKLLEGLRVETVEGGVGLDLAIGAETLAEVLGPCAQDVR